MTFDASPSFCLDTSYEKYLSLRGFSPAISFCSNLAVHQRRFEVPIHLDLGDSVPIAASSHAQQHIQCPAGSTMCSLLSELQDGDKVIARNVWYSILLGEACMDVALTRFPVAASGSTFWFQASQRPSRPQWDRRSIPQWPCRRLS